MDLSQLSADAPRPRHGRALRRLLVVAGVAALACAFGARAALADGVQLSLSTNAATPGSPVTMTATVTSELAAPTGTVAFVNAATTPATPLDGIGEPLNQIDGNTTSATFTTSSLPTGNYVIQAVYSADIFAYIAGIVDMASPSQALAIQSAPPPPTTYPTQVSLTAPTSVTSTDPVVLTATVTRTSGPAGTPTGTVEFIDTASGSSLNLGQAALSGGVATLNLPNLAAGPHNILALYDGDTYDNSSSSLAATVNSAPPADSRLTTSSDVAISPSTIAVGDTVTIVATITQTVPGGGQAPQPPGGSVTFTTDGTCGRNVFLASVPLGQGPGGSPVAANQAAFRTSTLQPCVYTVTASYTGDVFDQSSSASGQLTVLPGRAATSIAYDGDTTVEYGHSATLAATVTDQATGGPLANRTVTFTLGTQSCVATTDAAGHASCALVVLQDVPGTTVTASVPRDVQTEAGTAHAAFGVTAQPTTLTTGFTLGASTTTLIGTLVGDPGAVAGQTLTLAFGGVSCTATTNASGTATCSVPTPAGASATLDGSFAGSVDYLASAATSTTVQLVADTSLAYTGDTSVTYGAPATLSAKLTEPDGSPVAGRTVAFTLGTQTCSGTTDANGVVTCTIAHVTQDAGPYSVVATYTGDAITNPSSATTPFTVRQAPTTTVAATPTAGASATTLSATLTSGGAPLAGKTTTLALGSSTCSATTGANGVATCSVPNPAGATASFVASFAGDVDYAASSDTKQVTLLQPATIHYVGGAGVDYDDVMLLAATVTGPDGRPVPSGEKVTFTLGSQSCTTYTLFGYAFCLLTISQPAGPYTVTVAYAGDSTLTPTSTTAPVTVTHEETVTVSPVGGAVLAGGSTTLGGTLLEDGRTPIAGRTLTLTLGSSSCTGVTSSVGVATCTVTAPTTLGPTTAGASFAGDAYFAASSSSKQTIVYGLAPGGGSFVIGDRSTSGTVTFWGSQWAKDNDLSGGSAPSSFKGFAKTPGTPQCGTGWSTGPGNSSPPPSGPLPAYMAVIVTSAASKSGSTISGNTVSVAIVKTNAGYDSNPGHAGTGTVVATLCGGPANDTRGGGSDDDRGDDRNGHGQGHGGYDERRDCDR
ncbi:MAG TPA: Ig-like domain-containing protein [Gaiellaceae bacterium]|jgi:hypothetical protein|nr:Ig-like domain-containing protein [Gaiellaceae bacterium]